jgi:hypothetical protein
MKTLSNNWLTEGLIDFEYKKYVLLAYLQDVKQSFTSQKLYPFLQDLVFHYQNLRTLNDNKQLIKDSFPERLTSSDLKEMSLNYEKTIPDDSVMAELQDIISYSLPELQKHLAEGKDLYEYFESKMNISPIGITPLFPDEGYLFVAEKEKRETKIYEYQISIIQNSTEKYRGIYAQHIETKRKSTFETYEKMKIDLIKERKKLPNPATYLVESNVSCPHEESFLPIAKRLLVKYISTSQ